MLHNLARKSTRSLLRAQLALFQNLSDALGLTEDDRRQALELDARSWTGWLADGPLPAEPPMPELLRRLADAAFHLSIMAERRGVTA